MKITINDGIKAIGDLTFTQQLIDQTIHISGVMELNQYVADIFKIETNIATFIEVRINKEIIGTRDSKVYYEFESEEVMINEEAINSLLRERGEINEQGK